MKLILTISDLGRAKSRTDSRTLEKGGLTIGRASSADWPIDDPDRLLSKQHCRIEARSGRFVLTDTSTNGVFLNDATQPLGAGNTVVLNDGDTLHLGAVSIACAVDMGATPERAASPLPPAFSFVEMLGRAYAGTPPARDSFAAPAGPNQDWTGPDWGAGSAGDTVPIQNQAFRPPSVLARPPEPRTAGGIPDDWRLDDAQDAPADVPFIPDDPPRADSERQLRALLAGLAGYAAGNASLRALLGCALDGSDPQDAATDPGQIQSALASSDPAAVTEALAAGFAHQSALAAALRAALGRMNAAHAADFKAALADTYRQVFASESRRMAGGKLP